MGGGEKRDALRVPCDFPIRVYGQMREVSGRMLDISRSGLRLRVPLSRLMVQDTLDFGAIAHAVEQTLGSSFLADLHHEMLGQLVRKRLSPVRVCAVDPDADELEIGCSFETALNDDETVMLGVGLPPVGDTSAASFRNVPRPKHRGDPDDDQPNQPRPLGYEGIVHPTEGHLSPPLVGKTDGMLGTEALLAVPVQEIPGAIGSNAAALVSALKSNLGPSPRLEILDGLHMVWAGAVQLEEIELPGAYAGDAILLLRDDSA